jgi:hypothetical protein
METDSFASGSRWVTNQWLAAAISTGGTATQPTYQVSALALRRSGLWQPILHGVPGKEFSTSLGATDATTCDFRTLADGSWEIHLAGESAGWTATAVITVPADQAVIRRIQTYHFLTPCTAAIHPGFALKADPAIRYTLPLEAHEQPLAELKAMRPAVDWALPFPFHLWHDGKVVAIYGVDRSSSKGTLDFVPASDGGAKIGVHYPDITRQHEGGVPRLRPATAALAAGTKVTLTEVFAAKSLAAAEEPWIEAERMAAAILLRTPPHPMDAKAVAKGIVGYLHHCDLWEPDALGAGRGWFSNLWVGTQTGPARKRAEVNGYIGYFDFGWGEGIAVEIWMGAVRHWRRTGDRSLFPYVDEMTRNMDLFKRGDGTDGAYYDRSDGKKYGDFLMNFVPGRRIWTHSLGHTGSQLLQLYQLAPDYPDAATRRHWLTAATAMGNFLAGLQRADGDLPDILDDDNRELNRKPHRITARAVVCGLWTRLGQATGDREWGTRAQRLAAAVAPAIHRYEYFNQMLDVFSQADTEYVDSEAACYVLEGLVPLYLETRAPAVLALCQKAAAFVFAWTYFYDLPHAHRGIARGGQCCRTDDYPLLYPIAPAKAMEPVLALARNTGDPFYQQMADEMAAFLGNWQLDAPGQPWHGGMVHAMGQFSGRHWGPDFAGQTDTGMASSNSLVALECWLAARE